MRSIEYTPTLVSRPAKTAVTGAGAVGYESGSQAASGNTAALMAKTVSSIASSRVRAPSGASWSRPASWAKFTVPANA